MAKRTASELWDALEEATMDAELDAVLAMSPEERRRALEEAGFDIEKVHAQADALHAEAARQAAVAVVPVAVAPVAAVVPPRSRKLRALVVVPSVLAMAAGVALVVKLATPPPPVGSAPPQDPNVVRAEAIRRTARDACQAQQWPLCIRELDEAKALDPEGDEDPDVQALRREAHDHP
jgi:histidinol dehydrogenase